MKDPNLVREDDSVRLVVETTAASTGVSEAETVAFVPNNFPKLSPRLELLGIVGSGGMGHVFKAMDHESGRLCAVKVLRSDLLEDRAAVKRFEQELELVTQLTHPNVIPVLGHGFAESGVPFLIMELVEGKNLAEYIADRGPLSGSDALAIFLQICDALSYAHENGILHRDVKPSNVLISDTACGTRVFLVDFGIASAVSYNRDNRKYTETGVVIGSPYYMSPEQCLGLRLDQQTDVYSLGCLIYEVLTGSPPFSECTPVQAVVNHIMSDISSFPPNGLMSADPLYQKVEGVVMHCLAKEKESRYSTISDVATDLRLVLEKQIQVKYAIKKRPVLVFSRSQAICFAVTGGLSLFYAGCLAVESSLCDPLSALRWILAPILAFAAYAILAQAQSLLQQNEKLILSKKVWWQILLLGCLGIACASLGGALLLWTFCSNTLGFYAFGSMVTLHIVAVIFSIASLTGTMLTGSQRRGSIVVVLGQMLLISAIFTLVFCLAEPKLASKGLQRLSCLSGDKLPRVRHSLLSLANRLVPNSSTDELLHLYIETKSWPEALNLVHSAILQDPESAMTSEYVDRLLNVAKPLELRDLVQLLDAYVTRKPTSESYAKRALLRMRLGQSAKAQSDIDIALHLSEKGPPILANDDLRLLAHVSFALGDYRRTIRCLELIRKAAPHDLVFVDVALGLLNQRIGNEVAAQSFFERIRRYVPIGTDVELCQQYVLSMSDEGTDRTLRHSDREVLGSTLQSLVGLGAERLLKKE